MTNEFIVEVSNALGILSFVLGFYQSYERSVALQPNTNISLSWSLTTCFFVFVLFGNLFIST